MKDLKARIIGSEVLTCLLCPSCVCHRTMTNSYQEMAGQQNRGSVDFRAGRELKKANCLMKIRSLLLMHPAGIEAYGTGNVSTDNLIMLGFTERNS